ncbi:hypothetical protein EJB05_15303 [Eragrostis curvula]|uniref:Uncharacterized protein n=1 Tax=Eragrostis curvula TaxID=38414 RepID=A0A5J9W1F2_9POAL|nr:hypothetical protein EJB05_15303 [Eragrostis curvula]
MLKQMKKNKDMDAQHQEAKKIPNSTGGDEENRSQFVSNFRITRDDDDTEEDGLRVFLWTK